MTNDAPDILLISGSPRTKTCAALIELLEQGANKAGAKTQTFMLSKKKINPCFGCGLCSKTGNCDYASKTHDGHFIDDYLELKAVLERVDAVAIVAPVYFAGPPAQLKALYDRMQPYWAQRYQLGVMPRIKRPAQLFVVGSGGDSHGFAPLAGITKSAMAVAGFNLEKVNNFVGFCDPHDVPKMPTDEQAEQMSYSQIAHVKRQTAQQRDFTQRALDAGGAFARFVVKKKQANELADKLLKVEAELEDLKRVGDLSNAEGHYGSREGLLAQIDQKYDELVSHAPKRNAEQLSGSTIKESGDITNEHINEPEKSVAAAKADATEPVVAEVDVTAKKQNEDFQEKMGL